MYKRNFFYKLDKVCKRLLALEFPLAQLIMGQIQLLEVRKSHLEFGYLSWS